MPSVQRGETIRLRRTHPDHPRGYKGRYPMTFWFRDDKIVAVNGGPDDSNIIGAKYAREQCEKLGFLFKP